MDVQADVPYSDVLPWAQGLKPFDAQDFDVQKDPFAHYAWMREHAPVLRTRTSGPDVWFLSRYGDVQAALKAPKVFSSAVVVPQPLAFITLFDPPEHSRMRQVVAGSFTPKAVARLEEKIREFASGYLDRLVDARGGDVVEDFALKLTMGTIGTLLGVPASDFDQMKLWSDDMSSYFGRLARQAPGTPTDEQGANDFFAYMKQNLERAAGQRDESVASQIGTLWKSGTLSEREAMHFCAFLFVAGHETTTILLANSFMTLAEQPQLLERLRGKPEHSPRFIEEMARYKGTVQRISRITTQPVTIDGCTLPAGAVVKLLPGSANRDESKFAQADRFDIDRDTTGHLGFGYGIHSCLGAHLARLEGRVALELISKKVSAVELVEARPPKYVYGGNMANGGPSELHVRMRAH